MLLVCIILFLPLIFANAFLFHALSWFLDTVCLFQILFCITLSAFNLLVFLILCSHRFHSERAMCSLEKYSLKMTIIIIIIINVNVMINICQ